MSPKTWLTIPAMALACVGAAMLARHHVPTAIAVGALGAALAAAVRAFAGPSGAAAVAGCAAALLGALAVLDVPAIDPRLPAFEGFAPFGTLRAAIAGGAAMFAIAELVRPLPPNASPLPAIGGALVAGVLDPSYVALVAITGVRFVTGPWPRPRAAVIVPLGGLLAIGLALIAAFSRGGAFAELWHAWTDRAGHGPSIAALAQAGDVLGPITAVAAVAGIGVCAVRGLLAAVAVGSIVAGALAVDLMTGTLGAATPCVAALGAGVAIARLTAMVRWPAGQAFLGAAAGFVMAFAPAWALAVR